MIAQLGFKILSAAEKRGAQAPICAEI